MVAADRPHSEPVGIGLVGVGGFGEFCLEAFAAMSEVRIAATISAASIALCAARGAGCDLRTGAADAEGRSRYFIRE